MERREEVVALLRAARELLSDRGRWTKRAMARDCQGASVHPRDGVAHCFCSAGALEKCKVFDEDALVASEALARTIYVQEGVGLVTYNDLASTSHADVLALFDKAVAYVESGEFYPTCI